MDTNDILVCSKVSKKFCRDPSKITKYGLHAFLSAALGFANETPKLRDGEFWALRDVSFSLGRGESLGLLGLNGSGKSSLLKLIEGLYLPSKGEIVVDGRVGGIIELGAGFHPMLSGKENILLKCLQQGVSKDYAESIVPDIIEFAGLGEFINTPIKNYSSGMFARLAFSTAVHIEPDILLVDEVLAVGDFKFRQKCLEKINEMKSNTTVIYVSHDSRSITMFCDRALVLEGGRVVYDGASEDAVLFYKEQERQQDRHKSDEKREDLISGEDDLKPCYGEMVCQKDKIGGLSAWFENINGEHIDRIKTGDELVLGFSFRLKIQIKAKLIVGIPIWDDDGVYLTGISTDQYDITLLPRKDGTVSGRLKIKNFCLNPGRYTAVLSVHDGMEFLYRGLIGSLTTYQTTTVHGLISLPSRWEIDGVQ